MSSNISTPSVRDHFYPESGAGGYSRVDGTIEFYSRVNALLNPDMVVLDYGAGRGAQLLHDPSNYRRSLVVLKDKVKLVIGIDIDAAVQTNPFLNEAYVVNPAEPLPLEDESIDLVLSDWTFEHIQNPKHVATELTRVLKPGGWLCARTPNRWGYIGIGANMIPNKLHSKLLKKLQPATYRETHDVFPTQYRLNTFRQVRRHFPQFENYSYTYESEPAYFGNSKLAWTIARITFSVTPEMAQSTLNIFLQKSLQ